MSEFASEAAAVRRWLLDVALPLWWEVGGDRVRGGFHDAIGLDGRPVVGPRRARSVARQAFSYCEAGRLGWTGPWRRAALHALDLYNQAFALLAYAHGHRGFGDQTGWRELAIALRSALEHGYAHPGGGFR